MKVVYAMKPLNIILSEAEKEDDLALRGKLLRVIKSSAADHIVNVKQIDLYIRNILVFLFF